MRSLVLGTRQELPPLCSLGTKGGRSPQLSTGTGFQHSLGQKETLVPLHPGCRSKHQRPDKDQSPFTFPMVISAAERVLTHGSRGLFSTINISPANPAEPSIQCTRCFLHFPLNTARQCGAAVLYLRRRPGQGIIPNTHLKGTLQSHNRCQLTRTRHLAITVQVYIDTALTNAINLRIEFTLK